MIAEAVEFKGRKEGWQLHFQLREDAVLLEVHNEETMQTYEATMSTDRIKEDKNFSFVFETPRDLFKFLEANSNDLNILSDGTIFFVMDIPIGRQVKNIEFKIATIKRQLDQGLIVDRKLKNLEKSVETLKQEQQDLMTRSQGQMVVMAALRQEVAGLQRALAQKDEVLNSIFSQLGELGRWREQKQRKWSGVVQGKRRFLADESNPHSSKFTNMGSRYRKNCGSSWDVLICKHEIDRNDVYNYTVKQIRAGNNGSFMYGIGTAAIRGVNRAQDHKEFIGYYENTGNIYDRGQSKKGGAKIKDGETVGIEVDTRTWKVIWTIQGKKEAQCLITAELKAKPIYLAIVVYNEDSEIEFL